MADWEWLERAACAGADPEVFFPAAVHGSAYEAQVSEAKRVCQGCPVRAQCAEFAVRELPYGVAGGMSEQERAGQRQDSIAARTGSDGSDWVVVERLVRQGPVPGASRAEVARAAVRLVASGQTANAAALRLGVSHGVVTDWVARANAGRPLISRAEVA